MNDPQAPGRIFAAMSQIMQAVGHVAKTRKNTQQGYQFRGIDDLYAALQAPMVAAGVFCVPVVVDQTVRERDTKNGGTLIYTTLKVSHRFYAQDGSSVEAVTVGEAMDSGDKSSNKAMSAAMKYAFLEVFCIPTEGDNDSENQTHEVVSQKQAATNWQALKPNAIIAEHGGLIVKATPLSDAGNVGKDACEEQFDRLRELAGDDFAGAVWKSPEPVSMPARHRLLKGAADAISTLDAEHGQASNQLIGNVLKGAGWIGAGTEKPAVRRAVAALIVAATKNIGTPAKPPLDDRDSAPF